MKKLHIPIPSKLPPFINRETIREAIGTVVKELVAARFTLINKVKVAVKPSGKAAKHLITFAYQNDPIMGPKVYDVKVRMAKKGEKLIPGGQMKSLHVYELPAKEEAPETQSSEDQEEDKQQEG